MATRHALVGLGVAAVLVAGCDGGGDDTPTTTETAAAPDDTQASPGTEPEPPDQPTDDGDPAEASSPAPSTAGLVLASAEHPLTEQDGSLDIDLRAEEVGDLLRVEVTFTPRGIGAERTNIAELFGTIGGGNGMSARLIDPVNLLEYETVRPAVPHGQATPAYEDQPTTLNFYFGAPVEPLETFDFLLDFVVGVPDWPGFVDVPFATG